MTYLLTLLNSSWPLPMFAHMPTYIVSSVFSAILQAWNAAKLLMKCSHYADTISKSTTVWQTTSWDLIQ